MEREEIKKLKEEALGRNPEALKKKQIVEWEVAEITKLQYDILKTVSTHLNGGKNIHQYYLNPDQRHSWRLFYRNFLKLVEEGYLEPVKTRKKKKRKIYKITQKGLEALKKFSEVYD